MDSLTLELKNLIIEVLNLEDVAPDDIETEAPLFGDGLGLDSIDALELGIGLQKKYGVKFDAQSDENKARFYSVATLAKFISTNK